MSEAQQSSALSTLSGDDMTVSELVESLDLDGVPIQQRNCSLHQGNGSLRCTVMSEAWQHQGVDPDSPGTVDEYYFPDSGFLILDFNE